MLQRNRVGRRKTRQMYFIQLHIVLDWNAETESLPWTLRSEEKKKGGEDAISKVIGDFCVCVCVFKTSILAGAKYKTQGGSGTRIASFAGLVYLIPVPHTYAHRQHKQTINTLDLSAFVRNARVAAPRGNQLKYKTLRVRKKKKKKLTSERKTRQKKKKNWEK